MERPKSPLAPFSCRYTPQVPELLFKLNCTLAITTYQAGKLVFISAKDENSLIQLPRTFAKPMGLAHQKKKDKIALACKDEIVVFANSKALAEHYPNKPNTYDALYMPRTTFHTGALDIHDIYFGKDDRLYAVNTLFSCIVSIDDDYNFTPYWQPSFIDNIVAEDRCHLNGMAMENGLPKFVSAFNDGNTPKSWRANITKSGIIIDVATKEVITRGLAMPHSPRLYNNELYVLLSAAGALIKIDKESGKHEEILKIDGFVRGMDLYQDFLFIGLSKLRKNSSTFAKLPFADKAKEAGILIVHLPTASLVGKITYQTSVDEIYDVHILPDKIRPNILNTIKNTHKLGLSTPNSTYWARSNPEH